MAFISQKERAKLVKKTEQNYGLRKFIITAEIALLIGFIVMTFASLVKSDPTDQANAWNWFIYEDGKATGLAPMGIGMLIWALVVAIFGITSLILTWTLRSPKDVKKTMNKLNSSALSGKRIRGKKTTEITKSRTTIDKKKR